MPSTSAPLVLSACRALAAALPAQLDRNVGRRPVTGDPTRTAAWGDPPVTLRCGVALPTSAAPPLVIDGFPLVADERGASVTYTTSDRAVNAAVTVPKSYDSQGYLILPLLAALKRLPRPAAAPGA